MKKRFSLLVVLLFAACGASLAQSLADVARKTREDDKKPVKVFTDADLPARSSSASSEEVVAGDPASSVTENNTDQGKEATPAASGKKDAKPSDSSPARGKDSVAAMKKELDHYTQQRDAWKKSVERYQGLLQNEKSDFRRQTYQEALEIDQHNLEMYQQKIDDLQAQVSKAQQGSGSPSQGSEDAAGSGGHR